MYHKRTAKLEWDRWFNIWISMRSTKINERRSRMQEKKLTHREFIISLMLVKMHFSHRHTHTNQSEMNASARIIQANTWNHAFFNPPPSPPHIPLPTKCFFSLFFPVSSAFGAMQKKNTMETVCGCKCSQNE